MSSKNNNNNKISPFLKWAGGKRWLVNSYPDLFPTKFNRYIEPFLGGGSVFFYLQPNKAILSDTNKELIFTYKAIKENWKKVLTYLRNHHKNHNEEYYYRIRKMIYEDLFSKAAQFIYLNRTCWNGLYRVNLNGTFNVPIGSKVKVLFDNDDFEKLSSTLRNIEFIIGDFELLINNATEGDFLFIDPPYTVKHNNNSFIKYNEKLFSWDDQKRLCKSLIYAKDRGVTILATNAYHNSIIDLYKNEFDLLELNRSSIIAAESKYRRNCSELIIRSTK